MLVKDRRTPDPITITVGTSLREALDLVRSHRFHHLPIVDESDGLPEIVTDEDLVYAPRPPLAA